MKVRFALSIFLFSTLLIFNAKAKTVDPYKVLGVERNASQREIQKAFHKLSLQYHPDKNKNKAAQEKFAEINNAYDILSDEEKRKNYDLYGDEKGSPGFDAGHPGNQGVYTYFTSGGPGQSQFTSRPGEWQNMGGQGSSRSFSFSFGGTGGSSSFGFGLDDIFSDFFGSSFGGGRQFGGFSGSTGSQSQSRSSSGNIRAINLQVFKKEIVEKGMTWLLFFYSPSSNRDGYESVIEEVANSMEGALKVGSINCETEASLCKELGVHRPRSPRIFAYSYKAGDKGSLVEYNEHLVAKNLKSFCRDHLPRFSKRISLNRIEFTFDAKARLPSVLLLSTKKETPIIWRVLSGMYHERLNFYDTEVHDVSDPAVKKLGVDALPAIVGWLSNGEKDVLKTGISVKDQKSSIHELSKLLDGFEKENKKAASARASKSHSDSAEEQIPLLTRSNFDTICGEAIPVCIIGAFRSSNARGKLESIVLDVSQKSLSRHQYSASGSRNSITYALLDAAKQSSFLSAFDKSGFKSLGKFLVAYKPKRGKFAVFAGEMTPEEVERFIGSVLNGDVQFSKTRHKPLIK